MIAHWEGTESEKTWECIKALKKETAFDVIGSKTIVVQEKSI